MTAATTNETTAGKAATRRHGQALEQAIFAAVFEQLGKVGYAKLSMEGVAAAARTGKAALYRRWADKDALIVDALRAELPAPVQIEPTGDVRADILAILSRIRDALEFSYGATYQALKAESGRGAGLVHQAIRERVFTPYRQMVLEALQRGVEQGQVRPAAANSMVANVGNAMLIHRYFLEGPSPDFSEDYVTAVVDEVMLPMIRP